MGSDAALVPSERYGEPYPISTGHSPLSGSLRQEDWRFKDLDLEHQLLCQGVGSPQACGIQSVSEKQVPLEQARCPSSNESGLLSVANSNSELAKGQPKCRGLCV